MQDTRRKNVRFPPLAVPAPCPLLLRPPFCLLRPRPLQPQARRPLPTACRRLCQPLPPPRPPSTCQRVPDAARSPVIYAILGVTSSAPVLPRRNQCLQRAMELIKKLQDNEVDNGLPSSRPPAGYSKRGRCSSAATPPAERPRKKHLERVAKTALTPPPPRLRFLRCCNDARLPRSHAETGSNVGSPR